MHPAARTIAAFLLGALAAAPACAGDAEEDYGELQDWIAVQEKPQSEAAKKAFVRALRGRLEGFLAAHPEGPRARSVRHSLAGVLFGEGRWQEARALYEVLAEGADDVAEHARYRVVACLIRNGCTSAEEIEGARRRIAAFRERVGQEGWMLEMELHLEKLATKDARAAALLEGGEAPAFQATTLSGSPLSLAQMRGEVVLLHFWATWCEPSERQTRWLKALHERYEGKGLVIVGISLDEPRGITRQAVLDYVTAHEMGWPQIYDGARDILGAYAVDTMPRLILVGADGRVAAPDPKQAAELSAAVKRALEARE
jgi:thiol-disulfide isomerase/thioredoxin